MLFSCDFPLSAAAATVCVSSGFLFCFHDDDFPACDSYVCLSSTFMTIYQGKIHLHLHFHFYSHCHFHFHCWRTWSTLCFYWLHENIPHPPLFSFCFSLAAAIVSHRSYEVFFLFFFFFSASRRRSEEIERHVAIKFLIKLLDFTSTLFSVVAAE